MKSIKELNEPKLKNEWVIQTNKWMHKKSVWKWSQGSHKPMKKCAIKLKEAKKEKTTGALLKWREGLYIRRLAKPIDELWVIDSQYNEGTTFTNTVVMRNSGWK